MADLAPAPERRYFRLVAAATYLGVTTKTLRRMIADGQLVAYRFGGRVILIEVAELDQAMQRIVPSAGAS